VARDYGKEYRTYHKTKEQKRRRAGRNGARSIMKRAGRVKKGDGKDVHHKDGNTLNNKKKNLRVEPKSLNRARK